MRRYLVIIAIFAVVMSILSLCKSDQVPDQGGDMYWNIEEDMRPRPRQLPYSIHSNGRLKNTNNHMYPNLDDLILMKKNANRANICPSGMSEVECSYELMGVWMRMLMREQRKRASQV